MKRLLVVALGFVLLTGSSPTALLAETDTATDERIATLERQLEAIRAELETLKAKPAAAAPAAAPVASAATPQPAATPAAAPAAPPNPLAGINGVLGGVNLTGLVDAYYGYNANHPGGGTATEPFTATNGQASLNLLEVQLDKPVDKDTPLGFRAAFGFGQAINAVNTTGSAAQYLKEGYFSYFAPIGKGLQLDAGKFVTAAGAEVIESNQNWNYSRSLLFYYAIPYYHMGLRAKYTFNDKWSLTAHLVNGWNNVVATNSGKTGGLSLAWNPTKKLSLTENYMAGPRDLFATGDNSAWNHLSDTVIAYTVTPKLSLQANFDYDLQENYFAATKKAADYAGMALYARYQAQPKTAFAVRYEYFNDHDGLATNLTTPAGVNSTLTLLPYQGQHLNEITLTGERKIAGHLVSRLEYRHDQSSQDFFQYGGGKTGLGAPYGTKGQDTAAVGLIFVLEPGETK